MPAVTQSVEYTGEEGDEELTYTVVETEPPPPPHPGIPAGWFILAAFIAVAIFEIWAIRKKKNTISQVIQRLARGRRWFKWLGIIGMGILTWHIFWGFPW